MSRRQAVCAVAAGEPLADRGDSGLSPVRVGQGGREHCTFIDRRSVRPQLAREVAAAAAARRYGHRVDPERGRQLRLPSAGPSVPGVKAAAQR